MNKSIIVIHLMYLLTVILEDKSENFNTVSTSRNSKKTDNTIAKEKRQTEKQWSTTSIKNN